MKNQKRGLDRCVSGFPTLHRFLAWPKAFYLEFWEKMSDICMKQNVENMVTNTDNAESCETSKDSYAQADQSSL